VDTPNYTSFTVFIAYMKQSRKAFINMLLVLFGWQEKSDILGCIFFSPELTGSLIDFRSPMSMLFSIDKWRFFLMTFSSRLYRESHKPLLCIDQLASQITTAAKTIVTFILFPELPFFFSSCFPFPLTFHLLSGFSLVFSILLPQL